MSANTWHTVIAWHDSVNNTINLQVDNGTVNTVPYSAGTTDTTYPLSIGALPDGTYGLDGRIDEAAIYKRVLTSSERAWVYNNAVRRTYADLIAPPPGLPISYTYGDTAHKHAVTALGTVASYTYDANGNMISRAEIGQSYTQTFDTQNRLTAVAVGTQTTQFLYDPDGNLVEKINPAGSTVSKTIYVGGIYEEDKDSSGGILHRRTYYPAAGAMRVDSTLYYVLKDQLGSASVVTDANGVILTSGGEQRYFPYGEKRLTPGITATDKLFTGQRDSGLGIYYYGARFYSPYINRFTQPDSIVPDLYNPQSLNRYSYALNNPIRYTDPTGHRACGDGEEVDCNGNLNNPTGNTGGCSGASCNGNNPKKPKGGGGGNCGQQGVYSPKCSGWHFYTATNLVCPAEYQCTPEEMLDQFHRYVFPGQHPYELVVGGQSYSVSICYKDHCVPLGSSGAIRTSVENGGFTTINQTVPSHVLYDGKVIRHLYQGEDGAWYVSSYGFGNNKSYTIPVQYGQLEPEYVQMNLASVNQWAGPGIFNNADQQMLMNIETHH